jgi:DNA-binding MarR family transcriptional regulator
MSPHNVPARVCAVLACVGPLTPKQLALALDYSNTHIGPQLARMHQEGRIHRVSATAKQRQLSGGVGSAYAIGGR